MPYCEKSEPGFRQIFNLCNQKNRLFIAVGGLSRSGKSTFIEKLQKQLKSSQISSIRIPLDYWILPLEKRNSSMNVVDRFQYEQITTDLIKLVDKQKIRIYPYDAQSRSTANQILEISIANTQIVFLDGVIALHHPYINDISNLKIWVEIPETIRKQRVHDFYKQKGLGEPEIEYLYAARQLDESPYVLESKKEADLIINN